MVVAAVEAEVVAVAAVAAAIEDITMCALMHEKTKARMIRHKTQDTRHKKENKV